MRRSGSLLAAVAVPGLLAISTQAVAQEGCKPLTEFKNLPAVSALVDSAGIAGLPLDPGGPAEVLVSVLTGAASRVFVMDSMAAKTATGTAVAEKVLTSLSPNARNAIPAFRVRVTLGPAASVYVEPSVLCSPHATGPAPRRMGVTIRAGDPPPRSVTPRIKIGVNGEVLQVDIGSGTGYPEADRGLKQSLQGQRYAPALLDGRPVQVWLRDRQVELVR